MAASKAIGFLNFKFSADLTSFERAMNKAQKKLKKFGKSITKVGQNLSRNLTLPILGLGAAALKFGSDFEETDAKFKTVFSSIQKEAEKTAQSLKENFGLSELAAKEMLSGTGDLLVGFGFTEKKALELSNSVNELAVDLASFTNFSGGAKGASDALTKALLGERESIKSLGIAITETDLKKYAADQGLVWKELDRVAKATLTFELAQKQSTKAIGDFERTSGSFANQMRILQGDLVDVASEMGARLIPYAQAVIEKFKGLVVWFDNLSDSTKDNIVKWGLILAAIGPVLIIIGKVAIGLGVLAGAFKTVGVFLVANPWLAAAAAIGAVGYAIYDTFIATNDLITAQDDLNSISRSAEASIIDEKIAVELLTNEITAQGISLEDKKIALDKLKKISPKYYGSLKIAKGVVEGLDTATKNYTASILKQAKAEAMRQKLIDLNMELLEVEEMMATGGKAAFGMIKAQGELMKHNIQGRIDALTDEYKAINKTGKAWSFWSKFKPTTQTTPTGGNGDDGDDGDGPDDEDVKNVKDYTRAMDPLLANIKDYAKTMTVVGASMYKVEYFTRQLTEAQKAHNATIVLFKDIMFSAAMSAANSQENFFKSFIENIKKAIKQLLIQLAIMTVINLILGGPTMTIAKAFTGAKLSVLGLEEGGLVTGPTTALIGEGIGTNASNPEVVAPLDKLKQYMGGENQNIIVEGVLKGNDIYLSNKNTSENRLRTT